MLFAIVTSLLDVIVLPINIQVMFADPGNGELVEDALLQYSYLLVYGLLMLSYHHM